ncbi:MAG TPA: hypothetical protein VGI43_05645 [Mucilaginibacter sp.]
MVTLFVLLLIFIQDVRSRAVYWVLFPVLAILFILTSVLQHHLPVLYWQTVLANTGFILLQLLLVSLYFSIKNGRWTFITTSLLGWGDILLLLSIAFYLSFLNFLFFYIISLTAVLLIWVIWQAATKEKNQHIPLAGLQALIFTVFLSVDWWVKFFDLTNDAWLLHLITK